MANSKMTSTAAKSKIEEASIIDLWTAWRAASDEFLMAQANLRAADKGLRVRPSVVVGNYNQIAVGGTQSAEYRAETIDMLEDGIRFLQQFAGADKVDWADRAEKAQAELARVQAERQERRIAAGIPDLEATFHDRLELALEAQKRIVEHASRGMLAVAAKLHVAWFATQGPTFGFGRHYPETCIRDALTGILHLLPAKMSEAILSDLRKRENAL